MLLINLHPLKHSYVKFLGESNFAPILEFAIFYHFRHIYIENSYTFSVFCAIRHLHNKNMGGGVNLGDRAR